MWSSNLSKHANSSSGSSSAAHHRRTSTQQNGLSSSGSGGHGGQKTRQAQLDEDAWKLDESDDEPESSTRASEIAKVAAQAGLGRKASASNFGLQAPPRAATASQTSLSSMASSAGSSSNTRIPAISSPSTAKSPPQAAFKERGRQSSYGFWERISGFGASKGSDKERERAESPVDTSGYARFDGDLELEDNFDGTYSINTASTSSTNSAGLMAPATISRALSSGKIPEAQLPSSANAQKGKNRSTDSPAGVTNATIVGTPRTRSPGRMRKSERPRNSEDMRKCVRKDLEAVMKDPVNLLKSLSLGSDNSESKKKEEPGPSRSKATDYYNPHETPPLPSSSDAAYDSPLADHDADAASAAAALAKSQAQARRDASRKEKFVECLSKDTVDIAELRKHAWAGIPSEVRPMAWQLLLGYLPAVSSRRVSVLARKRQEYADAVKQGFARGEASLDAAIWHQIKIDVPRTNPGVPLWQFASTQASLEKLLYVWAIRHPASGYVQGINDLATPFYQVFLSSYIDCDPEDYDISALPPEALLALEADTFWCLSKLLDGIQDNYIFAQPGIHRQVARCQELCARVDAPLAKHLESEGVSFLQFSFRWFHLLFLRVLPVNSVIRMWDTYMSEGSDAFANFHTYVCLAFLLRWSEKLRSMDFQAIMLFLQEPVDHETWTESSTELLLSEAYMWSALWSGSKQTK